MIVVEPIALTKDTAVLRRRDYDALIKAYEDAADALALAEVRARAAAGDAEYVPVELAERIFVAASIRPGLARASWPDPWRFGQGIRNRAELSVRDRERQETRLGPRSGCTWQGAACGHRGSPVPGTLSLSHVRRRTSVNVKNP